MSIVHGLGFSLNLPQGAQVVGQAMGQLLILPPGADPQTTPALVTVRGLQPWEQGPVLAQLQQLDLPGVAMALAPNLGLAQVLAVGPLRTQEMGHAVLHIRELDALSVRGVPVRLMLFVVQGFAACVEVVCWVSLLRWTELAGPCLQMLAGLTLAGAGPLAGQVQAVLDPAHTEQVELRLVRGDGQSAAPITALPSRVGGQVIINVEKLVVNDHSIHAGDIAGTGITIGHHSTSTVR